MTDLAEAMSEAAETVMADLTGHLVAAAESGNETETANAVPDESARARNIAITGIDGPVQGRRPVVQAGRSGTHAGRREKDLIGRRWDRRRPIPLVGGT